MIEPLRNEYGYYPWELEYNDRAVFDIEKLNSAIDKLASKIDEIADVVNKLEVKND